MDEYFSTEVLFLSSVITVTADFLTDCLSRLDDDNDLLNLGISLSLFMNIRVFGEKMGNNKALFLGKKNFLFLYLFYSQRSIFFFPQLIQKFEKKRKSFKIHI